MNFLNDWMQSDWLKALGWTFVHSLWQIALTGLVLYIILRLIPSRSAQVRYTISTMAIWMIVIMSLSTFIIMLPGNGNITEIKGQVVLVQTTTTLSLAQRISIWLESYMPMMLTIWLGGVMILLIRLLFSLGWVNHMRATSTVSFEIQKTLDDIIQRLQLNFNPVAAESNHVSSPVTIGHLKPLILFPVGIINQLTPQEVEAVLTHELAHIVRRDYLSNLVQSFIETLFYYHPVIWWISGVVRTERENRADDLAISWCGDHLGYAKALMTVQEMEVQHRPLLAIGFASRKGAMLARIQRILHIPYKNHNQMEKTVLLSLCSLCFLAFTMTSDAENNKQQKKDQSLMTTTSSIEITRDTIPAEGTYRIHKKTDNQEINIEVENGDIKELEIDGKEIAPAQFGEYEAIIDELFGEMEAPPSAEGFYHGMPAMPAMPRMPHMPDMPPMPPMTPMPPMGEMEFEHFYHNGNDIVIGKGDKFKHKFFRDSLGQTKIIIIEGGDSAVIMSPEADFNFEMLHGNMPAIAFEDMRMSEEEWKKNEEEWKKNAEEWKKHEKEWKKMSEEWQQHWQENAQEWKKEWREHHGESDEHQQYQREYELRHHEGAGHDQMRFNEMRLEELEALGAEGMGKARIYAIRGPGMRMTDALVEEGLIATGEEAVIVLTPETLKINGKKMDDETHEKYLEMYEAQQGVELSGNSRVEFTTKTRRSM